MPVLPDLMAIYGRAGYRITTGIESAFSKNPLTEFTWIYDRQSRLTTHLGISSKELYFFECLFSQYQPENLFIIGNSFGWSTLALAMLNPAAQVVAIELGNEDFLRDWIARTNELAAANALPAKVVQGRSPEAVGDVVRREFPVSRIDLAFIDGYHSCEQVVLDIDAVMPFATPATVLVLHDVLAFGLGEGVDEACRRHGLQGLITYGTSSGIAILHGAQCPPAVLAIAEVFGAGALACGMVRHFREEANRIMNLRT